MLCWTHRLNFTSTHPLLICSYRSVPGSGLLAFCFPKLRSDRSHVQSGSRWLRKTSLLQLIISNTVTFSLHNVCHHDTQRSDNVIGLSSLFRAKGRLFFCRLLLDVYFEMWSSGCAASGPQHLPARAWISSLCIHIHCPAMLAIVSLCVTETRSGTSFNGTLSDEKILTAP